MFSRVWHAWPRVRKIGWVALASFATTKTVWAQTSRPGAEVLYEKGVDESLLPSYTGRTAVCFVDGRREAKVALQEAIRSKRAEDKLIVIHFVDSEAPLFVDFPAAIVHTAEELAKLKEQVYDEAKELTLQYKSILEDNKVTNVELVLMPCVRPQARAVKFVGDVGAEVVYVGTHNLGSIARTFLGSFSHHILHNTQGGCVVIAREKPDPAVPRRRKKRTGREVLEGEVGHALQSLVMTDASHAFALANADFDDNDFDEDQEIDSFILVGPPSLS